MLRLVSNGLRNYLVRKYTPVTKQCQANLQPIHADRRIAKSIKLLDLTAAFLIFGIGVPFSLLAFILELLFNKITAVERKIMW